MIVLNDIQRLDLDGPGADVVQDILNTSNGPQREEATKLALSIVEVNGMGIKLTTSLLVGRFERSLGPLLKDLGARLTCPMDGSIPRSQFDRQFRIENKR